MATDQELTQEQELAVLSGRTMDADVSDLKEPDTEQPLSDEGKPESPPEGQPEAAPPEGSGDEADTAKPDAKADEAPPIEDQLAERSGFGESDVQKRGRLEREHKAASKENRKLNNTVKSARELLKNQGLGLDVDDEGNVTSVHQLKDARKADRQVGKISFNDLTQEERDLFDVDEQKAIDLIQERTSQGLLNVKPTSAPPPARLSDERREAAIDFVKAEQEADESQKNPDFEKNLDFIEKFYLNAPNSPKALQALLAQEPELAYSLLNHKVNADRAFLNGQAAAQKTAKQKKASDSDESPDLGPAGGGAPSTGEQSLSDEWGELIANSGPAF